MDESKTKAKMTKTFVNISHSLTRIFVPLIVFLLIPFFLNVYYNDSKAILYISISFVCLTSCYIGVVMVHRVERNYLNQGQQNTPIIADKDMKQ